MLSTEYDNKPVKARNTELHSNNTNTVLVTDWCVMEGQLYLVIILIVFGYRADLAEY